MSITHTQTHAHTRELNWIELNGTQCNIANQLNRTSYHHTAISTRQQHRFNAHCHFHAKHTHRHRHIRTQFTFATFLSVSINYDCCYYCRCFLTRFSLHKGFCYFFVAGVIGFGVFSSLSLENWRNFYFIIFNRTDFLIYNSEKTFHRQSVHVILIIFLGLFLSVES